MASGGLALPSPGQAVSTASRRSALPGLARPLWPSTGLRSVALMLTAAAALNGKTIANARVDDDGTLHLTTDSGLALVVAGEPQPYTAGEAWRLSGWHAA